LSGKTRVENILGIHLEEPRYNWHTLLTVPNVAAKPSTVNVPILRCQRYQFAWHKMCKKFN